jgi:hypothetical protein
MATMSESVNKVDAIYELRKAAEKKGRIEQRLQAEPTPDKRDALLDAKLELEQKTVQAIDACHECGHAHAADGPHESNVVRIDSRKKQ